MADNLYTITVEELKNKYKVKDIWSYSRVNSFDQDPYEWFLKYIKKEPSDKKLGNAYGIYGNMVHDIMEDFYNGKIKREDCKKVFDDEWNKLSLLGLKFNNTDEESEKKLKTKYKNDLDNFFDTFRVFNGECSCEIPTSVIIKKGRGKEIFFGYIDFLERYDVEGKTKYHIIDYKTSTMYKGAAIQEHARQLLLYAMGLKQEINCDYEDIDVGWNFLKYVTVKEVQKNGNIKERYIERCELITKLQNSINKWLKEFGYNPTDFEMVTSLDELPKEVRGKFVLEDCIVRVPFTEESATTLQKDLYSKCQQIKKLVKEYNKTKDDSLFMWEPTQQDEFWLYNLCSYTSNLHKPFAEYLRKKELIEQYQNSTPWLDEAEKKDEDILGDFFKNI